jgi:hypothetical protein
MSVLEQIWVPRSGPGRPRTRPDRVLADKAYSAQANRGYLLRVNVTCVTPLGEEVASTW